MTCHEKLIKRTGDPFTWDTTTNRLGKATDIRDCDGCMMDGDGGENSRASVQQRQDNDALYPAPINERVKEVSLARSQCQHTSCTCCAPARPTGPADAVPVCGEFPRGFLGRTVCTCTAEWRGEIRRMIDYQSIFGDPCTTVSHSVPRALPRPAPCQWRTT